MKTSKKLLSFIGLSIASVALSGCSMIFEYLEDATSGEQQPVVVNPDVDLGDNKTTSEKVTPAFTYKDLSTYGVYNIDYCPNTGNPKLLIIPIWFTDSGKFIATANKDKVREDIEKAYLGTNEQTGWRSVKTFYAEESSNKVNLNGVVSEWYEVGKGFETFGPETTGGDATSSLVTEATNWYFSNHSASRSDFDSDSNGFLDGVMLIYGAPNTVTISAKNLSKKATDNLWAYCYWLQEDTANVSNPQPNAFFWASYDFMYSETTARERTGNAYGYGDTSHCNIDAHTFIHEMGHVFGLDDYYDYGPNSYAPAAGFSMQDNNVGSHDPFSYFALGWATPYVTTGNDEIIIGAFQKTRDLVLITPSWNKYNSPFDEYILLELYTPTGLNELDSTYTYSKSNVGKGPNATGIRMWHVDARLISCSDVDYSGDPVYSSKDITTNPAVEGGYGVSALLTNSYGKDGYGSPLGTSWDKYNLLQLIRNDRFVTYQATSNLAATDLFTSGTYHISNYSRQFVNSNKWNGGAALNFTIEITISGNGDNAQAKVVIK